MKSFTRNLALAALPALALAQSCPSVTTEGPSCSTCIRPACLRVETVTIPPSCACAGPIPTVTQTFPACDAPNACAGLSCETSYVVASPPIGCPTSSGGGETSSTSVPPVDMPTVIPTDTSSSSIPPVDMPTIVPPTVTDTSLTTVQPTGSVTCQAIGCNNGTLPNPTPGPGTTDSPPLPAGAAGVKPVAVGVLGGVAVLAVAML